MTTLKNLIIAVIVALWIGAISIFSIQNITAVSLKFLLWESIKLPIGILLSFCVAGGLIIGMFVPLLLTPSKRARKKRLRTPIDDLRDFDFEE